VDVAEDGTIYALTQRIVRDPPDGLPFVPIPCLVDDLVVLSPTGVELKKIPILEAFRDSPYALLLNRIEGIEQIVGAPATDRKRDFVHTNSAKVLSRRMAPSFPVFKPGQVLISLRQISVIAVLDTETRSIVWATCGPWRGQHSPEFLDNGHLLLFDNIGTLKTRVLEFDPKDLSFPWAYCDESTPAFTGDMGGMSQRLPNGNTLILDAANGNIMELTQKKELAWSCSLRVPIACAERYSAEQASFLGEDQLPRP
jgi:hypothetical protein